MKYPFVAAILLHGLFASSVAFADPQNNQQWEKKEQVERAINRERDRINHERDRHNRELDRRNRELDRVQNHRDHQEPPRYRWDHKRQWRDHNRHDWHDHHDYWDRDHDRYDDDWHRRNPRVHEAWGPYVLDEYGRCYKVDYWDGRRVLKEVRRKKCY